MVSDAPRHPLRDALAGMQLLAQGPGEVQPPVRVVTGVVTAVQTATSPHTVRVQLAEGTVTEPLPFLGWWAPTVNDVVWMLQQGPALYVLGGLAPANLYVPPAPIVPDTPDTPPPAPPTVRTVGVSPIDRAYWSPWGWRREALIQGGPNHYRGHWFYGSQIAAAKGAGTIVAASIYVERTTDAHGVNGAANVRLGTHAMGDAAGSGAGALGNVSVQAQLTRGQAAQVPLSAAQIAALNGGHVGVGLEPGATSYSSADYLKATASGASGQLSLTIQG